MSFRSYHQMTEPDRSGLGEQVGVQRERVRLRLGAVRRVVAVVSGKGGVGKSFVAAGLALAAARRAGAGRVGVLDADLKGPTVARLLGARGPLAVEEGGVRPASGAGAVRVMSTELLLGEGAPLAWRAGAVGGADGGGTNDSFVWRGTLEAGALREFLSDVAWGELELLLVDTPPDADRLADLAALVPTLAGAVVVTIPSEESCRSVERAMRSAVALGVRLVGVVENMSGYACGRCGEVGPLFEGDAGAALAAEFGVPLLARIPFAPGAAGRLAGSDAGDPVSRAFAALDLALAALLAEGVR